MKTSVSSRGKKQWKVTPEQFDLLLRATHSYDTFDDDDKVDWNDVGTVHEIINALDPELGMALLDVMKPERYEFSHTPGRSFIMRYRVQDFIQDVEDVYNQTADKEKERRLLRRQIAVAEQNDRGMRVYLRIPNEEEVAKINEQAAIRAQHIADLKARLEALNMEEE